MPQASDELREEWDNDYDAEAYLETAGVMAEKGMFWNLPNELPDKVWRAIQYLCDEWDFSTGER
jgi:hypothetical protein